MRPVEQAIDGVEGLIDLARLGPGLDLRTFEFGRDVDIAAIDVLDHVGRARRACRRRCAIPA